MKEEKSSVCGDILAEKIRVFGERVLGICYAEGSFRNVGWKEGLPTVVNKEPIKYFLAVGEPKTNYTKIIDK